jgi:hypothetical protein
MRQDAAITLRARMASRDRTRPGGVRKKTRSDPPSGYAISFPARRLTLPWASMVDLPLEQVPREGEIIEVLYRLSRPVQSDLDLMMVTKGAKRRLRFSGTRVMIFQKELPPVLHGLEVQDIRDHQLDDLTLWVSVANDAITFFAKTITELTQPKLELSPKPRASITEEVPVFAEAQLRRFGKSGIPQSSFRYRARGSGGTLRGCSVRTRPYP